MVEARGAVRPEEPAALGAAARAVTDVGVLTASAARELTGTAVRVETVHLGTDSVVSAAGRRPAHRGETAVSLRRTAPVTCGPPTVRTRSVRRTSTRT